MFANSAVCAFTCFRWNLEWRSSDARFRPIFVDHWGPLYLSVRSTAIHKGFCWPFLRIHPLRWLALGRGRQFRKSSVLLSPALWVPAENRFGTCFRSIYPLFEFVYLLSSSIRFSSSRFDLTFYWRIQCDETGRVQQSARLIPNILDTSLSKCVENALKFASLS